MEWGFLRVGVVHLCEICGTPLRNFNFKMWCIENYKIPNVVVGHFSENLGHLKSGTPLRNYWYT